MALVKKYKPVHIGHPLYDCFIGRDLNGNVVGYHVTFYYIHDITNQVYVLYNTSDWFEQINLMRENGDDFVYFKQLVFVSPLSFPTIHYSIHEFVKLHFPYVLNPYYDPES